MIVSLFLKYVLKSKVLHGNDLSYNEKTMHTAGSKWTLAYMKGKITEMSTTHVKFKRVSTHGGQQNCKTEIRKNSPFLYVLLIKRLLIAYCFLYWLLELFENQRKN